jgi:CRP-like cAMP-binding protein
MMSTLPAANVPCPAFPPPAVAASPAWPLIAAAALERRTARPGADLVHADEKAPVLLALVDGWAMRYRHLPDGRRQIFEFLLPGDLVGLQSVLLGASGHSVRTITRASYWMLREDLLVRLLRQPRGGGVALLRWLAVQERRIDERLALLGSRSAAQRIGHLMLDLAGRLQQLGLAEDWTCPFPLQRQQIGDALGVSRNHVRRSLDLLQQRGLARVAARRLSILDPSGLQRFVDMPAADRAA